MKSTGIVRRLDDLGRITLPMELRRNLGIKEKDQLEIFTERDSIVLRKFESGDIFTGTTDDLILYHGKKVSKESIIEMAKIAGISL